MNGTSTMADPVPIALSLAVKVVPEAVLDVRASTRMFEIVGGPGHVPPDMSSPPVSTRVEPTITHTVVTPSDGCHLTVTVPLAQSGRAGVVDTPAAPAVVVTVAGDEPGGFVGIADVDGEEHPAMDRLAATRRARRQVATPET